MDQIRVAVHYANKAMILRDENRKEEAARCFSKAAKALAGTRYTTLERHLKAQGGNMRMLVELDVNNETQRKRRAGGGK